VTPLVQVLYTSIQRGVVKHRDLEILGKLLDEIIIRDGRFYVQKLG